MPVELAAVEFTLPGAESPLLREFGLWGYEGRGKRYARLRQRLAEDQLGLPLDRLLGHADPVQGDVMLTAARMDASARGVRRSIEDDARASGDWGLLLQVDSDYGRLGSRWGDGGTLYFCMPEGDLRAGRFDRVQAVTQDC